MSGGGGGRVVPSTTSHKHEDFETTLEVFARLGFHDLDLNLWHLMESGVTVECARRALAANSQRVRIASGGWCDFFDSAPKIDETRRSVARQVAMAEALGVRTLRLFFGRLPASQYGPSALAVVRDNLRRLSDAHPDTTFVFENHGHDEASARPSICVEILAAVDRPNIRMNFDPINAEFAGTRAIDALTLARPFIAHVHLKGLAHGEFCAFGEGAVDLEPVIASLLGSGYDGLFTVEYEGAGDRTLGLYRGAKRATARLDRIAAAGSF